MSRKFFGDAKYFSDMNEQKLAEIGGLLDSKQEKDKLEALKRLIALMSKGHDMSR